MRENQELLRDLAPAPTEDEGLKSTKIVGFRYPRPEGRGNNPLGTDFLDRNCQG